MFRLLSLNFCVLAIAGCAQAVVGSGQGDGGANPGDPDGSPTPGADASNNNQVSCDDVPAGWSRIGAPIEPPGGLFDMGDIAIDSAGRPVIVFSGGSPSDGYAYRFDGTWTQLGDVFNINPDNSGVYDLTIRAKGDELIAMFIEGGGATASGVYVNRLPADSTTWTLIGGGDLSTTNANVVGSDIFIDGDEFLVAWSQYSEGFIGRSRVHVRRFSGDTVVSLDPLMGGIAGPGASAITPSITIDGNGNEVVFFSESGVRHLQRNASNTDWDYLGEPTGSGTSGFGPKTTTDSLGRVLMTMAAFDDTSDANVAFLQRWNGTSFDLLGRFDAIAGTATHATPVDIIVGDDDNAVIAITERQSTSGPTRLFVGRRGAGDVFTVLGGGNLSGGDGTQDIVSPQMVKDACGLYVVFGEAVDEASERTIHVFRWKD